jgi:hypothetical protein
LENPKETEKFLDSYDHPNWNQEKIHHIVRYITNNGSEAAVKGLLKEKSVGPNGITAIIYQTFKDLTIIYGIEREGTIPNPLQAVSITFIPKLDKETNKKKRITEPSL